MVTSKYIKCICTILIAMSVTSCSLKKNTAATRNYTAFITRYNIHYNGSEHYKEALKAMEDDYEDDYTRLLFVHPAEAYSDPKAPQPSASFKTSIEKAQKAIQLRSIKRKPKRKPGHSRDPEYQKWMKRDEYNPFIHNSWMLMGRSQYLSGDYLEAAATFLYIEKHFNWLPQTVTEAKIWQALCYCSLNWTFEAEAILSRINESTLTDNAVRGLYYLSLSDLYIHTNNYAKAAETLPKAIEYAKGSQKSRLWFLLGQIETLNDRKGNAYQAFIKAEQTAKSYRARINARLMQSHAYAGSSSEKEIKSLKRMTRYERNKQYLDRIYHAIAVINLNSGDTLQAINNLKMALNNAAAGNERALTNITLGNIYFEQGEYVDAQPCYAEAAATISNDYPDYETIKRRSDVLDELGLYAHNVELQDSLLKLADMTADQQLAVVQKIIDQLKRSEKEEAENNRREELNEQRLPEAVNASGSSSAPVNYTRNTDDSWYFYNKTAKEAGRAEFQRRWGKRKLEDNWRRRNKSSFDFNEFENTDTIADNSSTEQSDDAETDDATRNHETDPHYPEFYLKNIPSNEIEQTTSNDIIQESMYNMGIILKDKLEDYKAAEHQFKELLRRYPDNIYRLDAYYNLYLMYSLSGKTADAERTRQLIVSEFPKSKLGEAMVHPDYFDNLRNMNLKQEELYESTYEAYLNNENNEVHKSYQHMREAYPMSEIMPKFMFLEAMAYVTENDKEKFKSTLQELLQKYPDTDMTPLASSYLKQLNQGRELQSGEQNIRGMIWQTKLTNDTTSNEASNADSLKIDLNPDAPQLLILLYSTDSISGNQLIYDVAYHNFNTFTVKDFDLEQMKFGNLGLLIIKGFANQNELLAYRKSFNGPDSFKLPEGVTPVMISEDNFKRLMIEGRSFDEYFEAMERLKISEKEDELE